MIKVDNVNLLVDFLLTMCLCILPYNTASSQDKTEEYFTVETLKMSDGLPNQNINDIFFDDKGFAWISTFGGGVSRYDGDIFVTFSSKTSQRIKSDYVSESCQDDFDRLWVAGSSGVDVLDLKTLETHGFPEEYCGLSNNLNVSSVCKDSKGCIWFSSWNTIYRVSFDDTGKIERLDSLKCSSGSDNLRLKVKDVDDDGTIWLMLQGKLYKAKYNDDKGIRLTSLFPSLDFGQDNRCSDILRSGNEIWVGTLQGLYRINRISGETTVFRRGGDDCLSNNEVSGLCFSEDGEIVVGTLGGVDVYDPVNDIFIEYSSQANKYGNKILPGSMVRSIKLYGNKLWVGLEVEGLAIMQKKRLPIINISFREKDNTIMPATPARSMIFDSHGRFWVGATEYGVGMNEDGFAFKFFNTQNSNLKHNTVNAFCEDGKGRLWMGSVEGDLNYISLDNPSQIINPAGCDSETAKKIDGIYSIRYDSINESLWILAISGLYVYNLEASVLREYDDFLFLCTSACIDSQSRLWVSHFNGLRMIDLHSMEHRDYPEIPSSLAILPDDDGFWIGTFSQGLLHMELNPDGSLELTEYTEKDGLSDNRIRGMLKDGSYLWITTENGLNRFDTEDSSFESFGTNEGLESSAFCEGSIAQSASGKIYLGQKEGLSILQSSYIPGRDAEAPYILISSGWTNNQNFNLIYNREDIKIKERDGSFTLFFSDLSFSDRAGISYETRILPDKNWNKVYGEGKYVRYERIPGGAHVVQVRAVNDKGEVLSQDEISFYVKPKFFKSVWFLLILIIVMVCSVQGIIRLRTMSIKKKREQLQAEVDRQTMLLKEQKLQIQNKVDELSKQNEVLQKQVETLAGNKILIHNDVAKKDSKFMDDIMNAIQRMYNDPDLDIYALSEAVGMSRSILNDKLQEAIGQSIAQFIRTYRLNVAKELITSGLHSDMNVSDIAYEVGFNDPKYFTRCFTKQFGVAPSFMINESPQTK